MSNICTNLLIMTHQDFSKIQGLFSAPLAHYEQPFLDFNKILPLGEGNSLLATWGSSSNSYRNEVLRCGEYTHVEFLTGNNSPLQALAAMAQAHHISFDVYAIEGGCCYAVAGRMDFEDDGEFCNEVATGKQYMQRACEVIFATSLEQFLAVE